jgi:hypothetical protein
MMSVNFSKNDFLHAFQQMGRLFLFFLSGRGSCREQKKALLIVRRAFDMLNMVKLVSDLSSRICGMELAPYNANCATGCQGFIGPLPSAFLDKKCKELVQI